MNKSTKIFRVVLFVSFIFGFIGLFMTVDSYYKDLSADATLNQIEFFRSMPAILSSDYSAKMPAYTDSTIFSSNPNLSGKISAAPYMDSSSIIETTFTVKRSPFSKEKYRTLFDTRIIQ